MVACLDHEYQPRPVASVALDAGGMEGRWGKNAAWYSGHIYDAEHIRVIGRVGR